MGWRKIVNRVSSRSHARHTRAPWTHASALKKIDLGDHWHSLYTIEGGSGQRRMKRKGSVHQFPAVKKKKFDDQEVALSEFLLLYESGCDEKQLIACKFLCTATANYCYVDISLFILYATALTYFLTRSRAGDEPQCCGDIRSFVQGYLDKYADCQHILAPLVLEREKRNQDLVNFK